MKQSYRYKAVDAATLTVAVILSTILLNFAAKLSVLDFEDAATLGAETTTIFEDSIHCRDARDIEACIASINPDQKTFIWFGNSQLHAINQYKVGEKNSTYFLAKLLPSNNIRTFSQPNGNLQEHLVLFEYLHSRVNVSKIILPVVFDDMREDGLRPEIAALLQKTSLNNVFSQSEIGKHLISNNKNLSSSESDLVGLNGSIQEMVEESLNKFLIKNTVLWGARPQLRGEIYDGMYRLRNVIFNIKPTSKRKKIIGRYSLNLMALQQILQEAKEYKIQIVLYIAPIKSNNGETPYIEKEYIDFKRDISELSKKYQAEYYDFDNLIPDKEWGLKDSTTDRKSPEIDFMHFKSIGHQRLAKSIANIVKD